MRPACLVALLCSGCQALDLAPGRAERLWQEGQAAMEAGRPDQAIALYQESLAEDAGRAQNHLSLAAAYVEKGEDARACAHLGKFLEAEPGHKGARLYYAELL